MGDRNPIRTLGDYSRLSTRVIETPLNSLMGTMWCLCDAAPSRLVQNRCSFHRLRSEDPNQHLKDFLKLVDSLDLDVANREMTTSKLCNDILMFQQHQDESLSEAWTHFKDSLQKVPHHEMFRLLKELTTSRTPKKVLAREEARYPITKNVNAISFVKIKKDKNIENNKVVEYNVIKLSELNAIEPKEEVDMKKEVGCETNNEPMNYETYNSLPVGPKYDAILKNKITKKEDMGGNFVIPCNIGGLKYMDTLVDQGSDVNVMALSIYNRITNEKPIGTNIRLSLASHLYIFPLGVTEDVLVEIGSYIYPLDSMILDVKEDKKKPFILGTPFLTTAKADIRFDKGTITLKYGKNKISFFKIPESPCRVEEETKNDIDPVAPTNTVSRSILEWEEGIKLHKEKEMEFNQ
nr:hypothetical protein [Tanacetum cinerariifolium]